MFKFIFRVFATLGLFSYANAETAQTKIIELAGALSHGNPAVLEGIRLFNDDRNKYFKRHESELLERGIEASEDISTEIVLVDLLGRSHNLVYADYKEDAQYVLGELNTSVGGKLGGNSSYEKLVAHIKSSGKQGAISNYFEGSGVSYMNDCLAASGYKLMMIDEGSDAYPVMLLSEEDFDRVKKIVAGSGVSVKSLGAKGFVIQ